MLGTVEQSELHNGTRSSGLQPVTCPSKPHSTTQTRHPAQWHSGKDTLMCSDNLDRAHKRRSFPRPPPNPNTRPNQADSRICRLPTPQQARPRGCFHPRL
ncbi:hypothetical protein DPEC_G00227740 [Dallia pectoralis]|uniref:Uncharacterized protein n=1 Tax=Dallia pectoralis TaxID=75939 RepID=A0ACC2G109_DALPE|nr:hypothetical protein DPEC_G00227740 [Dallia pectoralis]